MKRNLHYDWIWLAAVVQCALGCADDAGQGAQGHEILSRVEPAREEQCPHGGTAVLVGLDRNENRYLDDAEIVRTIPQCQEQPSSPEPTDPPPEPSGPTQAAVRVDKEPPGENCAQGGAAIRSGPDANGNGVLDEDEIEATDYVCDEALVTRMAAEPAGENCAGGGIVVQLGRDTDSDESLDDDEVEWTEYECSDVISHDVSVSTPDDLALLRDIRVIGGALLVQDTALASVDLPALEHVGGRLQISGNANLVSVSLPALVAVGGALALESNAALADLDLSALDRIGGRLSLYNNDAVVSWPFSSVRRAGGGVTVHDNQALAALEINLLHEAEDVVVTTNASLGSLSVRVSSIFDVPSGVGPVLRVEDNPVLLDADLNAARFHSIRVARNALLQELAIQTAHVARDVIVEDVPALHDMSLISSSGGSGADVQIDGALSVSAPLRRFWAGVESALSAGRLVVENTQLVRFEHAIAHVRDDVVFRGNTSLSYFTIWSVDGGLTIEDNDALASFFIYEPRALSGDVQILDNDMLPDLSMLQQTDSIGGSLVVRGNASLRHPWLSALEHVGGSVVILDNPALEVLGMDRLQTIRGSFSVSGTAMTAWSGLRALRVVEDNMAVTGNPGLSSVGLSALVRVGGNLHIGENPVLGSLDLDALERADLRIVDNPTLPVCVILPLFARVQGTHEQHGNDGTASCP
jgi:hypothetical protein